MNSIYNYKNAMEKEKTRMIILPWKQNVIVNQQIQGHANTLPTIIIITKYEASLLVTTITKRYKSFYERKSMMVEIITHRSSVQNLTHIFQRKNQERVYNDIYYYWFLLCRGRFMQSKQFNHPNDVPNAQIEEN